MAISRNQETLNRKIAEKIRQLEEESKNSTANTFSDENLIKYKVGTTFVGRLLWDDELMDNPFIHNYAHFIPGEDGKKHYCVCSKSIPEYRAKNTWRKHCVICDQAVMPLWDSKSKMDQEFYKASKVKYSGHIMVYVISDPVTPENNGKVKVLYLTEEMTSRLYKLIYGSPFKTGFNNQVEKEAETTEERYGNLAFTIENGYDIRIACAEKAIFDKDTHTSKNVKSYDISFSIRPNTLKVDLDDLNAQITALNFVETFERKFDADKCKEIYEKVILSTNKVDELKSDMVENARPNDTVVMEADGSEMDEIPINPPVIKPNTPPKPVQKPTPKPATPPPPPKKSVEVDTSDLDDLLNDINFE